MATITGLTAARMLAIEAASIISGAISGDNLILTKYGGGTVNAGNVRGPQGVQGVPGAGPFSWAAASTGITVTPNSVECVTGSGSWDRGAYSVEGWARGCALSFQPSGTGAGMIGLNSDPASANDYLSLDYAMYFAATAVEIYENGALAASVGTWASTDVFSITYDGAVVRYWKNGSLLRSVGRVIGAALYLDCSFNSVKKFRNLWFGPMGEAASQPPVVTAIPTGMTSADHGREVYLRVDEATAYGGPVLWRCKYAHYKADGTTLNPETYKWDVIGAVPLALSVAGNLALGNSTWTDGESITMPISGVYDIAHDANLYYTSSAGTHNTQVLVNGSAVSLGNEESKSIGSAVTIATSATRKAVVSGQIVKSQYNVPGTGGIARYRNLTVRPVRVG